MSDTETRTAGTRARWLPWVVAAVLAVVVAAIAVVLPHVHAVSARAKAAAADSQGDLALPVSYEEAVNAAATEAANLLTYSRKSFDADWQRSLDGATGNLLKDHTAQKADALANITKNKIDLKATVQQKAFESADGKGQVLVLVTVNGFTLDDTGQSSVANPQRLEMTMVDSHGTWLASDLTSIGIQ